MAKKKIGFGKIVLRFVLIIILLCGVVIGINYTPDIPRAQLVARYGQPPSSFIALSDGSMAHVRDQGSRDNFPLVLIHGSNASLHTWEPWVAQLEDRFRIISLDMPGHGLTGPTVADNYTYAGMAEFVIATLDAIGIDEFAIAGNSMGGAIAAAVTLQEPKRVKGLVLVDASGLQKDRQPGDKEDMPIGFRLAAIPGLNLIMRVVTPKSLVRQGLEASFTKDDIVTDDMVDRYFDLIRHPGNRRATGKRFQYYGTRPSLDVGKITAPTLVLWGRDDGLIPVSTAERFKAKIKDAKVVIYEQVGHIPMEEIPARSARDVRFFLDEALK